MSTHDRIVLDLARGTRDRCHRYRRMRDGFRCGRSRVFSNGRRPMARLRRRGRTNRPQTTSRDARGWPRVASAADASPPLARQRGPRGRAAGPTVSECSVTLLSESSRRGRYHAPLTECGLVGNVDLELQALDHSGLEWQAELYRSVRRPISREVDCPTTLSAELWTQNLSDFADIPGMRLHTPR